MDTDLLSKKDFILLKESFLFRSTDECAFEEALTSDTCCIKSFFPGEAIDDSGIGVILSGSLKVMSQSGKNKLTMRFLSLGEIFGVSALFSEGGYATELLSVANSKVAFFSQEFMEQLMSKDYSVAENYIRFLSDRIRFLNRKIACLAAGTVEESLALHLLDSGGNSLYVDSFSSLAEIIGVGRASLYRALDKLESDGLIARSLHEITILDKLRLEKTLA